MLKNPAVLLVEDDGLLVLNIEDEFAKSGFRVFSALNGTAAIAELDSDPEHFFCLITDIKLGSAADGWTVARHARLRNPEIVVIYVTGDSEAAWQAEGVTNSVLLKKPLVNGQLTEAIARLRGGSARLVG